MGIYTPIGNYDLDYFFLNRIIDSSSTLFYKLEPYEGGVILTWHSTQFSAVIKTMVLSGADLQIENNAIVGGTITGMELWVNDRVYFAGSITDTNLDGATFQTHVNALLQGQANDFLDAIYAEAAVVVGTSGTENYEHNFLYAATEIDLGGGDDRYQHARTFGPQNSLVIDGGDGEDFFYAGSLGGLTTIDFENQLFIDTGGNEHVILNFEAAQGTNGLDRMYGALDRENRFFGGGGDDLIYGGNQNDILSGGANSDRIYGLGGDDLIMGDGHADFMDGGDGVDTVSYYSRYGFGGAVTVDLTTGLGGGASGAGDVLENIENVIGTTYRDILVGSAVANRLSGMEGDDSISGGAGDDVLVGGLGADEIDGGDGVDTASYEASELGVTVFTSGRVGRDGEAEGDQLTDIENIIGSGFDDLILLDSDVAMTNRVDAGAGDDRVRSLDGGDDVLNGDDGDDALVGGVGNDRLSGGADNDRLFGGGGNDRLFGDDGHDMLSGQLGDDNMRGGAGDDGLIGGAGADILFGDIGNDSLSGGADNDRLFGGAGNDGLVGGGGDDLLRGQAGADDLRGGSGDDNMSGGTGEDQLFGDAGNDTIDGQAGNDEIYGGTGDDRLRGGNLNDQLFGGAQGDLLLGEHGLDILDGGTGNDVLIGGSGSDVFVFGIGYGSDVIRDFEDGVDQLDISGFGFADYAEFENSVTLTQRGSAVRIDFANGEVLRLENLLVSQLDESDFTFEQVAG